MDEFLFQKNDFDVLENPPTECNVDFLDIDIDDIIKDV